jgi:hypothetical protein
MNKAATLVFSDRLRFNRPCEATAFALGNAYRTENWPAGRNRTEAAKRILKLLHHGLQLNNTRSKMVRQVHIGKNYYLLQDILP